MVRLSNNTIQMIFPSDNVNYLLDGCGEEIYEIRDNKVKETIVLKEKYVLSNEQLEKMGVKRGMYVQGVLGQIKNIR